MREKTSVNDGDLYSSSELEDDYAPVDGFMPFDDHAAAVASRSNETSDVRSTAAAEVIGVALYPVVTWFAVLLTLTTVGLVGNVIVLIGTTSVVDAGGCRGRVRRASALVLANLGVALTSSCVVLGPLEFAVVAENYVKRSVASFVCRAAAAAYHLLAGTVVSCLVFYALFRRRQLQRASDVRQSSSRSRRSTVDAGTCSASFRRQLASLRGTSAAAAAAGAVGVLPTCRSSTRIVTLFDFFPFSTKRFCFIVSYFNGNVLHNHVLPEIGGGGGVIEGAFDWQQLTI